MASRYRSSFASMSKVCLALSLWAPNLMAQDPDDPPEAFTKSKAPILSIHARTVFPLYLGVGAQVHATPQFHIGVDFGQTPGAYAEAVGSTASRILGHSEYKPTIVAAFSDNSLYRMYLHYAFSESNTGWAVEVGLTQISSSGEQKVSDVTRVATNGRDYQDIETTIVALGYRPYVNVETKLVLADIMGMYQWQLPYNLRASVGAGLAKVTGAEVRLSTDVQQFDDSKLGMALLGLAENDLSSGLETYGLTPLLSLDVSYQF